MLMRHYCLCIIFITLFLQACSSTTSRENEPENIAYNQTGQSDKDQTANTYYHKQEGLSDKDMPDAENRQVNYNKDDTTASTDIWQRIRQDLVIKRNLSHPSVKSRLAFYSRKQKFLDRVADRATPYIFYIVEELEKRNLPLDLALLPIVESAYQPFAHSRSRASGIWQFIPSTGKHYGLKQNWWYDGRRDIVAATDAALTYLQKLYTEFNGDWLLALAAYNAGERKIALEIERNRKAGKPTDFWSLSLKRETMGYVPSLLAVAELVANPEKYQIVLKPIPNQPHFAVVNIGSQIDLSTVADMTELSMNEIYTLNPGLNKWATDPDGPHHLLIPLAKTATLRQQLSALPVSERIKWQRYEIKAGDTLGKIANMYRTDINTLKQANKLRSNMIRAGHTLLIPSAIKPLEQYSLSQDVRKFNNLQRSDDGQQFTYIIKSGDSLWNISQNYGVSVEQLLAWNGLNEKSILTPGKKLIVYARQTPDYVPAVAHTNKPEQQHISYIVKQGDSLWHISRRYGVSVEQIQKWNGMNKRTSLRPGQNLDIYVGQPPADV
jgi:membrane-bound lytic murein transglycosylase D